MNNGKFVPVRIRDLSDSLGGTLKPGQAVAFKLIEDERGERAVDVRAAFLMTNRGLELSAGKLVSRKPRVREFKQMGNQPVGRRRVRLLSGK